VPKYIFRQIDPVRAWKAAQPFFCLTFQSPQLLATSTGMCTDGSRCT